MEKHTINNPLHLKYNTSRTPSEYTVNKPNVSADGEIELVSKEVAQELLNACKWAKGVIERLANEGRYPEFLLTEKGGNGIMPLVDAINNSEKQ